jgi:hypothetical protein
VLQAAELLSQWRAADTKLPTADFVDTSCGRIIGGMNTDS